MHEREIFSDLAQAFNCVTPSILLAILHAYGIQGVSDDWFRSFLTNTRQGVEVTSPNSTQIFFFNWGTVKHGVLKDQF
jgi:hypothetical protein